VGSRPGDWLVHLYEEEGDQFFQKLNGLFSGLLIDKRRNRAFLFNDRYGFDRVYVAETRDGLFFASEAKAILNVLPDRRAFDPAGVSQFLTYGCTLHGRTLFQGIQLLPGGSVWTIDSGKCSKTRYFAPAEWEKQPALSVNDFIARFEETFQNILPRYFDGSGRVGISLTAGLDTRMIMACRPERTGAARQLHFCRRRRRDIGF
jgi:asparagine synthase (glutamine-hydrolysing)